MFKDFTIFFISVVLLSIQINCSGEKKIYKNLADADPGSEKYTNHYTLINANLSDK